MVVSPDEACRHEEPAQGEISIFSAIIGLLGVVLLSTSHVELRAKRLTDNSSEFPLGCWHSSISLRRESPCFFRASAALPLAAVAAGFVLIYQAPAGEVDILAYRAREPLSRPHIYI